MAGFFYYLPGVTPKELIPKGNSEVGGAIDQEVLTAHGITTLWDVRRAGHEAIVSTVASDGPDGKSGTVLYVRSPEDIRSDDEKVVATYRPDRQIWRAAAGGKYFLGYADGHLPLPEDLARPETVLGRFVPDGDGHRWLVPVARQADREYGQLPTSYGIGRDGQMVARVKKDFLWIWELAGEVWDAMHGEASVDETQVIRWVIEVLSCNYRIGVNEQAAMFDAGREMIEQKFSSLVFMFLVDGQVLAEIAPQKKTTTTSGPVAEGSDTTTGSAAETPATDPPTAS